VKPEYEYGGFVALDKYCELHDSINLKAQSLHASWQKTQQYVSEAYEIIDASIGESLSLDSEESVMILDELGDPPEPCYPIYIISVDSKDGELPVYIGKTSSNNCRFAGGHDAITKLHDPIYHGLEKKLYLGCVMLLAKNKSYYPLEWVTPLSAAKDVLRSIENQLIYDLKPKMNVHGKANYLATYPMSIHIQNFSDSGHDSRKFLNDHFVHPEIQ
jgi:hypothetical protein